MTTIANRFNIIKSKLMPWARSALSGRSGRIINVIFSIVALAAVGQILYTQREAIQNEQWQFNSLWAIATLVALAIDMTLGAYCWHLLVGRLTGFNHLNDNIKFWWQSNLAKRIPGNIWYVANRILAYEDRGVSKRQISMTSGLELVVIFLSGLILTVITIPYWQFSDETLNLVTQSWIIYVVGAVFVLLIHPKVIGWLWKKLAKEENNIDLSWKDSVRWLLTYGLVWIIGGFVMFGLIATIQEIPLSSLPQIIGIWTLASTISLAGALTFTSMGVREVSLVLLLTTIMPASIALIVTVLLRLLWLFAEFVSGLIAFRM